MRAACIVALLGGVLAAQQPEPILARLSAETTNIVVVRDPLPVLERLLASPATAAFLTGTESIQKDSFGRTFDAATLRRQLAMVAPMIPAEIVIAAPTRTLDRLSHAAALFACCNVLQMMGRANVTDAATLAPICAGAREHLAQLDSFPLQAWVRARDERTAEGWFDTLAEAIPARAQGAGLTATVDGERITLRGEPFAQGTPVRRALEEIGVDMAAAPVWAVEATIEQRGAEIELRVGRLAPPPCAAAMLGWVATPDPLLFVRSDVSDAAAYLTAAYSAVASFGAVDFAAGDVDLMVRLVEFLNRVDVVTEDQTATLRIDRGLEWTVETPSVAGDVADGVPAILRRLMVADEPFFVTVDTLDVMLASWLSQVAGGLLPEGAPGEALEEFLDGEASAVFAPGVAVVARSAAMRGRKGRAEPLPFAAVALVARPQSTESAADFMRQITNHVARLTGGSADGVWREQDLGLGVPAHALELTRALPAVVEQQMDWDFVPHWFVTDEVLVVSTDPALSKELLARGGIATTAAEPGVIVHERLRLRGATIHDAMAGALRWIPLLTEFMPEQAEQSAALWDALRAVALVIDTLEFGAETRDGVRRDRLQLLLREPAPK